MKGVRIGADLARKWWDLRCAQFAPKCSMRTTLAVLRRGILSAKATLEDEEEVRQGVWVQFNCLLSSCLDIQIRSRSQTPFVENPRGICVLAGRMAALFCDPLPSGSNSFKLEVRGFDGGRGWSKMVYGRRLN